MVSILVISAHPDDETLGCGGTMLKHHERGDTLYWLIVTQAHEPQWSKAVIERKTEEVQRVAAAYGVQQYFRLGFPTIRLDTVSQVDLINAIRDVIAQVTPQIVYLVHSDDVHSDHQAVFAAAMSVLKPFYMAQLGVQRILSYETLSSTEAAAPHHARAFIPSVYSDITLYIERKIEIMGLYESEAQPDLMPRGTSSIRALARFRGATIGVEYAEAFELVREIG
jgi:LmbE family N-acetylglucosaminyl deacetylase